MKHLLFAQFIIEKVSGRIIIVHPTFIECILCAWFSADNLRGLSPLTLVIALVSEYHYHFILPMMNQRPREVK